MDIKKTINIGILAHVDAGKTTVTENLLFNGGVIKKLGNVDDKNTQTDTMELEKERGITIKSTAVSFTHRDVKINIIDTPGHMDFIAEVERAMGVLDGAILVVSSVEGVQSQTKIIFDTLKRLKIPTIIFINKLDRMCSDYMKVYDDIKKYLSGNAILMESCNNETAKDIIINNMNDDSDEKAMMIDILSGIDDEILEKYVTGDLLETDYLLEKTKQYTKQCMAYPIFMGSAILNIGTDELLDKIIEYLPVNDCERACGEKLSAIVFKIERSAANEKRAYVRVFSGYIGIRSMVSIIDHETEDKVKSINTLSDGRVTVGDVILAGDIGVIGGIPSIRIGDIIGEASDKTRKISFVNPTIKSEIRLLDNNDKSFSKPDNRLLYRALSNLSDEDPLLNVQSDSLTDKIYVSLFGEVQKEIIEDTLKRDYKLNIEFLKSQTIFKETPIGTGKAIMHFKKYPNIYPASIQLRVEPLERGQGIQYRSEVTAGYLPKSFLKAIEDAVYETCAHGLYGWELTDILVTLLYTKYDSVTSTPADFRDLTPMVLMEAVDKAKTKLLEPINEFEMVVPELTINKVLYDLKLMNAVYESPVARNDELYIKGTIPLDTSRDYQNKLLSFTSGKGLYTSRFIGYNECQFDESKISQIKYVNPLNKIDYIRHKKGLI